ncbi:MAG: phosphatidate cytidylyltransferase [Planctomycetota bacterium]
MLHLTKRLLVGGILLTICFTLFCLDYVFKTFYLYYVMTAFLIGAGLVEFYGLVERRGIRPHKYLGVVCGTVLAVSSKELWRALLGLPLISAHRIANIVSLLAVSAVIVSVFIQQILKRSNNDAFTDIAATFFGVIYIGFLGSFFVKIRHLYDGRPFADFHYELGNFLFILLVLFACKGADVAAYLVGRKFGRHPLIPEISPKKTVEGGLAALAFGVLLGLVWGVIFAPWLHFKWFYGMIFGVVLAGAGLAGDLAESLTKRKLAVKDAANYIPTFGGVLDLIDAPLFAAPAVYYAWVLIDTLRYRAI